MSKQYDMAANGWEYVEHYFGPFWKKSDRTIHQAAPGSQWELMEGSKTIATMAHDSIDPVGALARIADERELRAKHEEFWAGEKDRIDAVIGKPANWQPGPHPFKDEPCGFNAAMDRKNAIAERSAAALESIAASLAKMADQHRHEIPMASGDAMELIFGKPSEWPKEFHPTPGTKTVQG